MNILNREDLSGSFIVRSNESIERKNNFKDIQRFLSVGFSSIFTANAQIDCSNGILAGDQVYFKINNEFGVSRMGRVDESSGSCEDVAEVLGFYALRNLNRVLGKKSILKTTPYEFAEYSHESFFKTITHKTGGFVESDTMYGCISKNCVAPNAEIIHGDSMLSLVVPNNKVTTSSSNTLYNYDTSLGQFVLEAGRCGQELLIHPISTRYLANTMFWDYFYSNSDRHCKNINFQKIPLGNNKFLVEPLAVIDNGGGLCMQSNNCEKFFSSCGEKLSSNGIHNAFQNLTFGPFNVPFDFYVGEEAYPNGEFRDVYEALRPKEQIVVLLSTSKELYEDFANMYKNLDFAKALEDMHTELRFNPQFLPHLTEVATSVFTLRQIDISKSMANYMGENFSIEAFNANPNYYLDKFGEFVQDNSSNLHIATNEEITQFNETLFATFGVVSQHNMSENLPQVQQTGIITAEQLEEGVFDETIPPNPEEEIAPQEEFENEGNYESAEESFSEEENTLHENVSSEVPPLETYKVPINATEQLPDEQN